MTGMQISSTKDKFLISIDKNIFDNEIILNFIEGLKIDSLAKEVDLLDNLLEISEEIKDKWWKDNKASYLNL